MYKKAYPWKINEIAIVVYITFAIHFYILEEESHLFMLLEATVGVFIASYMPVRSYLFCSF
jgi:hypothetical protein